MLLITITASQNPLVAGISSLTYDQIKEIEASFPFPQTDTLLFVGTFDAGNGEFVYSSTITPPHEHVVYPSPYFAFPPPPTGNEPLEIMDPAVASIGSVNAKLLFRIVNQNTGIMMYVHSFIKSPGSGGAQLDLGYEDRVLPAGTNELIFDIKRANFIGFSFTSGDLYYQDVITIDRPPIVGAGAFIVPAIPITILYEPPQNQRAGFPQNWSSWRATEFSGTSNTMSWSGGSSTSRPVTGEYEDVNTFRSVTSNLANLARAVAGKYPIAGKIADGLSIFSAALGSEEVTQTQGSQMELENTLTVTISEERHRKTSSGTGPGRGDVFLYLKNVRLAWIAKLGTFPGDDVIYTTLISYEKLAHHTASELRQDLEQITNTSIPGPRLGPISDLDSTSIQALLNLDPFVSGGTFAHLGGDRFRFIEPLEIGDSIAGASRNHQVMEEDLAVNTIFSMRTMEYSTGFLSFLGIGIPEDKTVMTKVSTSCSKRQYAGNSIDASYELFPGEYSYDIDIYFDRIFETYVFRSFGVKPNKDALNEAKKPKKGVEHQF
ncbi:hypothetical protein KKH18_11405 [bacterium]|nr:hypothetical protein [bacterium]